ncbi:MAG: AI-2E family transporter [Hyphomicrobiales bacterium]
MTIESLKIRNIVILLLFFVLAVYCLVQAKAILIPLSLGIIIAYLLFPLTSFLEKKRVPRILANFIGIFLIIFVLTAFFLFIYLEFNRFTDNLNELQAQANLNINKIAHYIRQNTGLPIDQQKKLIQDFINKIFSGNNGITRDLFKATSGTLFKLGILPVFIFYLLYYRELFERFIKSIVSSEFKERTENILAQVSYITPRYILGIITVIVILSIINSFGLWIIGVRYPIVFGVISAVFNFIPYFGTWIGASIPILFTVLTGSSPKLAIFVLLFYAFVQFLENNILTPNITGSYVNLNPFITILSIIVGGLIWGIAGMFVIIPFMAMFKILCEHSESMQPLAILIGKKQIPVREKLIKKIERWFKL